jgi:hypothetical protein
MSRKKDSRVSDGIAASRIINDPVFDKAFRAVEDDIVNALASIVMTGDEACVELVLEKTRELQANRRFRRKLAAFVGEGKVAERQLETVANQPKRVNDPRWSK